MAGGKGKSVGGKASGAKDSGTKTQKSHSAKAGLQVSHHHSTRREQRQDRGRGRGRCRERGSGTASATRRVIMRSASVSSMEMSPDDRLLYNSSGGTGEHCKHEGCDIYTSGSPNET